MTAVALWLNVFVRQARHIGIATNAQRVNVIAPLMTNEQGIFKQTTYWLLLLFSRCVCGQSLVVRVQIPIYRGRTTTVACENDGYSPLECFRRSKR